MMSDLAAAAADAGSPKSDLPKDGLFQFGKPQNKLVRLHQQQMRLPRALVGEIE